MCAWRISFWYKIRETLAERKARWWMQKKNRGTTPWIDWVEKPKFKWPIRMRIEYIDSNVRQWRQETENALPFAASPITFFLRFCSRRNHTWNECECVTSLCVVCECLIMQYVFARAAERSKRKSLIWAATVVGYGRLQSECLEVSSENELASFIISA